MPGMADSGYTAGPTLVTGAYGFIGRHLVRALLGQGRRVLAYCRTSEAFRCNFSCNLNFSVGWTELRLPEIIEPAHKSLNRSVSGCIFRLVGFLFATITIRMK